MLTIKIIAIIAILITSCIAATYPFYKRMKTLTGHDFPKSEALASGVFLGAGLIHMLGDSSREFSQLGIQYPMAFLIAGSVFLILLFIEHIATEISHKKQNHTLLITLLALFMLSFHSFFAGGALGLSHTYSTVILIFIAILAHKWAASFALAVQINKSAMPLKQGLVLFAFFAIMTPLGILCGQAVSHINQHLSYLTPIVSAIAAGTFLYIGTLHGLQRSVMIHRCCNLKDFSLVILGFALMAVVAIWS